MIQVCNDQLNFQNKYDPALNENENVFFFKESINYVQMWNTSDSYYLHCGDFKDSLWSHWPFDLLSLNFRFVIMMNLISCQNIVNNDSKNCIVILILTDKIKWTPRLMINIIFIQIWFTFGYICTGRYNMRGTN